MVYKNFAIRFLSSFILVAVYLILFFNFPNKIIYFVSFIYFFIILEISLYFKRLKIMLITYVLLSYLFALVYFANDFNHYEFTAIIFYISCFDSACYLIGKIFGKKKIFINISPNKTYEGFFGGLIITNLISLVFYLNFDAVNEAGVYKLFIFTNIIIIFSFFGDLIQSFFKRLNTLKDSSNFIPGHGGFFDRFDSFLLVIMPLSLLGFFFK